MHNGYEIEMCFKIRTGKSSKGHSVESERACEKKRIPTVCGATILLPINGFLQKRSRNVLIQLLLDSTRLVVNYCRRGCSYFCHTILKVQFLSKN